MTAGKLIETRRLQLAPFARADLTALHDIWTMPEVRRYLWDDRIIPREQAEVPQLIKRISA